MITEALVKAITDGSQRSVFAVIRPDDMGKSPSIFDEKLSRLARNLRRIHRNISWQCNASAESYRAVFPRDMSPEQTSEVVRTLSESELSIESAWGFGALA